MSTLGWKVTRALLVGAVLIGIIVCVIDIIGGLFYLADNTILFFVPPVVAIALILVASRPRTTASSIVVWTLVILFVASYAIDNWRWALERFRLGGFYTAPDVAAIVLVAVALYVFHKRPAS